MDLPSLFLILAFICFVLLAAYALTERGLERRLRTVLALLGIGGATTIVVLVPQLQEVISTLISVWLLISVLAVLLGQKKPR